MKILQASREKGLTRQEVQARLFNEVLRDAGLNLMETDKAIQMGIKFTKDDALKAAARILRMGWRLDGASSRLRCPNRTRATKCE